MLNPSQLKDSSEALAAATPPIMGSRHSRARAGVSRPAGAAGRGPEGRATVRHAVPAAAGTRLYKHQRGRGRAGTL